MTNISIDSSLELMTGWVADEYKIRNRTKARDLGGIRASEACKNKK